MHAYLENTARGLYYFLEAQNRGLCDPSRPLPSLYEHAFVERVESAGRSNVRELEGLFEMVRAVTERVAAYEGSEPMDANGEVYELIQRSEEAAKRSLKLTKETIDLLLEAAGQNVDYWSPAVRYYEQSATILEDIIGATQQLRHDVAEKDADRESPLPGRFDSADELIAALNAD